MLKASPMIREAQTLMAIHELPTKLFAVVPPISLCSCCRDARDVTPDPIGGAPLCPVCMFQIVRCGRCETHRSRTFYEQLLNVAVESVPDTLLKAYGYRPVAELPTEKDVPVRHVVTVDED